MRGFQKRRTYLQQLIRDGDDDEPNEATVVERVGHEVHEVEDDATEMGRERTVG